MRFGSAGLKGQTVADLIFSPSDDPNGSRAISRRHQDGELIYISAGIYARSGAEPIERVVLRNWSRIVGHLVPDGVVTDRTGFDSRPYKDSEGETPEAVVFMSAPKTRNILRVRGLVINVREGPGPVESDLAFLGTWIASPGRLLLDNLAVSRQRGIVARTVGVKAIENYLDSKCTTEGEGYLNKIRDEARSLAPTLGREDEFGRLDNIIGTLLHTRQAKLVTSAGQARARGEPYDEACLKRLTLLQQYLSNRAPVMVADEDKTPARRQGGAFIEAYFSNYIEGTQFLIDEAVNIVFDGQMPAARPQDGHDVLGTYLQLVELEARRAATIDPNVFIDEVRERHRRLMGGREDIKPGVFKDKANRAGNTTFVTPDRVVGTLKAGIGLLGGVTDPFSRAVIVHFLLADVHPFNDGNGRISRIMMTKELIGSGLSRIVIPTVYRGDYLDALRALSRNDNPSILVRSLEFCQKVSAACSSDTTHRAIDNWARSYAFCEDAAHARLSLPDPATVLQNKGGVLAPADYWSALEPGTNDGPPFRF